MTSTERDLVERLRAIQTALRDDRPYAATAAGEAADALASIRAELAEALADKARVDELLTAAVDDYDAAWKALKPFADAGGQIPIDHGPSNEPTSGDEPVTMSVVGCLIGDVTVADFERARAIAGEQKAMTDELLPPETLRRSASHIRHGHTSRLGGRKDSPTYVSWQAMLARCRYVDRDTDAKYINRGIAIDPSWQSFENFLADMGERPAGTTLDRVDNEKNYGPSNCRWATPIDQARNRRNAKLTYDTAVEIAVKRLLGARYADLAAEYGCSESLPREIVKGRTWKDAGAEARRIVEALHVG